MTSVSTKRTTAAGSTTRNTGAKKAAFDLTKKARVDGLQIKSGEGFTVKLPPGKWKLEGLNGRSGIEFKAPGQKKFLPLEQFSSAQVKSGVEFRAKSVAGLNSLAQLTFTNEKGKELFLEMRVDGGKAPKNPPITGESSRLAVSDPTSGLGQGWKARRTGSVGGGGS